MIRHIVLTKFSPDTPENRIADIYGGLQTLTETLSGARAFTGGRSSSPEDIERGYTHAFTVDFASWAEHETYASHPEHLVLGQRRVAHAVDGIDGLIVLDIEV